MIKIIPNPNYPKPPPPPPPPRFVVTNENRKYSAQAADLIMRGFSWSEAAEGNEFWYGVCRRLEQIGKDGILKDS